MMPTRLRVKLPMRSSQVFGVMVSRKSFSCTRPRPLTCAVVLSKFIVPVYAAKATENQEPLTPASRAGVIGLSIYRFEFGHRARKCKSHQETFVWPRENQNTISPDCRA